MIAIYNDNGFCHLNAYREAVMASTVEKRITVDVPIRTAYNQWTQFEAFPKFMRHILEVVHKDDTHLHWKAEIGGRPIEWDAVITTQVPDQKIAWKSTSGIRNSGTVCFYERGPDNTEISLQLEYTPEGFVEKLGNMLGLMEDEVEEDLKRFKEFIEARQVETGQWRGEVKNGANP